MPYIYKKNNFSLTIMPVEGKVGVLPNMRDYKINFRNIKKMPKIISYAESKQVQNISYIEGADLIVEVQNVPTASQLTIVCSGEDIEIDSIRIVKDDIISIISDLPIKTNVKQRVDDIIFSNELNLKRKRIEIKKLAHIKDYLEKKYIELFLKLLEYIDEV